MKRINYFLPILILIATSCTSGNQPHRPKHVKPKKFGMYETYNIEELMYNIAAINDLTSSDSSQSPHVVLQDILLWGQEAVIGYALPDNIYYVDSIFHMDTARHYLPNDIGFMWSADPIETADGSKQKMYALYAVKVPEKGPRISNKDIASASSSLNQQSGQIAVSIAMTEDGAYEWEAMTRDNIDRYIAMVVEDKVLSCPRVVSVISAGMTEVSGNFTVEEAEELAAMISN